MLTLKRVSFGALLLVCAIAKADAPQFTIEAIRVDGLRFVSSRIVIAETRLTLGQSYSESQLHDALSRVQRLPFVLRADFSLERGTERDRFLLVITIEETRTVFIDYRAFFDAIGDSVIPGTFRRGVLRHNEEYPNGGVRAFVGSRGVLTVSSETHGADLFSNGRPIYGIGWTQYDLFGTRASVAASVRYREESLNFKGFSQVEGRTGLRFNDHLLFDVTAAYPFAGNTALRAGWHRENGITLTNPRGPINLVSIHYDHPEIAWVYNTTNDLLFPTAGSYVEARAEAQSSVRGVDLGRGLGGYRYTWTRDLALQGTRYIDLTSVQSLVLGGGSTLTLNDRSHPYWARGGYAATLWKTPPILGTTTLRFECGLERVFGDLTAFNNLNAGIAVRTAWGVAHLDFRYAHWRSGAQ